MPKPRVVSSFFIFSLSFHSLKLGIFSMNPDMITFILVLAFAFVPSIPVPTKQRHFEPSEMNEDDIEAGGGQANAPQEEFQDWGRETENSEQVEESSGRLGIEVATFTRAEAESPGTHAALLKFGSKIGMWAMGISIAGIIAILSSSNRQRGTSVFDRFLLVASLLSMVLSFLSGGALLVRPLFNVGIFSADRPESARKIKFIIGVAILFMALVMAFVIPLIIRRTF